MQTDTCDTNKLLCELKTKLEDLQVANWEVRSHFLKIGTPEEVNYTDLMGVLLNIQRISSSIDCATDNTEDLITSTKFTGGS